MKFWQRKGLGLSPQGLSAIGLSITLKEAYQRYLRIAGPAVLQGLLLQLALLADLIMVGSLGVTAVAAVGVFEQPEMLILLMARSLAVPIIAMVSRRYGEGRLDAVEAILKQGLVLTVLLYTPLLILAYIELPSLIYLAGGGLDLLPQAIPYASWLVPGLFFSVCTQTIGAAFIGMGYTKEVFKSYVVGNIVNVFGNAFCIYGWFGLPRLGIAGIGIATMAGYFITLSLLLYKLSHKPKRHFLLTLQGKQGWCLQTETLHTIKHIGGPALGEQGCERFGMFVYTRLVAELGVVALAVHYVCMNLCDVYYLVANGLSQASSAKTGKWLGRHQSKIAVFFGHIGIQLALGLSLVGLLVYGLLGKELMELFSKNVDVVTLGSHIMLILAIASFPQALQAVYAGVLRGAGDTYYVMKYTLLSVALLRPLVTYGLCFACGLGLYGAWLALLLDQTIRMICARYRVKGRKWAEQVV